MKEKYTTKGKVVAGVLALALSAGVARDIHDSDQAIVNKDRVTAVDTASSVLGRVVVLKAGANYRLSPDVENTQEEAPNNLAGSVPQGKELVIKLPLVSSPPTLDTADQAGWIGFMVPGTSTGSIHNKTDRAKNTVWADLSALESQQLAVELPYGNLPEGAGISGNVPATVADDGSINITGGIKYAHTFSNMDTSSTSIENKMATIMAPTTVSYKDLLDLYSGVSTQDKIAVSSFEQAGSYEQSQF